MPYCTVCGKQNDEGARYCSSCGYEMNRGAGPQERPASAPVRETRDPWGTPAQKTPVKETYDPWGMPVRTGTPARDTQDPWGIPARQNQANTQTGSSADQGKGIITVAKLAKIFGILSMALFFMYGLSFTMALASFIMGRVVANYEKGGKQLDAINANRDLVNSAKTISIVAFVVGIVLFVILTIAVGILYGTLLEGMLLDGFPGGHPWY